MQSRDAPTGPTSGRLDAWVVLALASCAAFAGRMVGVVRDGTNFGLDFGVFHAGGDLIRREGYEETRRHVVKVLRWRAHYR